LSREKENKERRQNTSKHSISRKNEQVSLNISHCNATANVGFTLSIPSLKGTRKEKKRKRKRKRKEIRKFEGKKPYKTHTLPKR
jgi:hypothetical protein